MDSQWLKTQFSACPGKNKAGLAATLGINASAISKMLAGTRQIKANEYIAMRRYFGLPVDGAAAGAVHDANRYVVAPLLSGNGQGLDDKAEQPDGDAWVIPAQLLKTRTNAAPDKIKIFTVHESAMAPDFMPGEHVLVDISDKTPSPAGIFVVSDGIGHIVRQCEYVPHSRPPTIKISAANTKYESHTLPLSQAGVIGRIIAKLQWL